MGRGYFCLVFLRFVEIQMQPCHTLKGSRSLLPSLFKVCGPPWSPQPRAQREVQKTLLQQLKFQLQQLKIQLQQLKNQLQQQFYFTGASFQRAAAIEGPTGPWTQGPNPITAAKNTSTAAKNTITAAKNSITAAKTNRAAIILYRSFLPTSGCY